MAERHRVVLAESRIVDPQHDEQAFRRAAGWVVLEPQCVRIELADTRTSVWRDTGGVRPPSPSRRRANGTPCQRVPRRTVVLRPGRNTGCANSRMGTDPVIGAG